MAPTADMPAEGFQCQNFQTITKLCFYFSLCRIITKALLVQCGNKRRGSGRFSIFLLVTGNQYFAGIVLGQKAFNINTISLGNLYGSGGYIRKAMPVNSPSCVRSVKRLARKLCSEASSSCGL